MSIIRIIVMINIRKAGKIRLVELSMLHDKDSLLLAAKGLVKN